MQDTLVTVQPAHAFHFLCTWSWPGSLKQSQPCQRLYRLTMQSTDKSSDSTQVLTNQVSISQHRIFVMPKTWEGGPVNIKADGYDK